MMLLQFCVSCFFLYVYVSLKMSASCLIVSTDGAAPVGLFASSSAGLAVEFGAVVNTATGSTVCTVIGSTVTLMGTGTCTIVASQGGNANVRAAANVRQSFTVTPGALIVTIVSPVNNQQLSTPANLTIVATALERGGTIAKVVFYNGSTVLGKCLATPRRMPIRAVKASMCLICAFRGSILMRRLI